jgi:hypothetical protein
MRSHFCPMAHSLLPQGEKDILALFVLFHKIPPIPLNQYKHRLCKLVAALSLLGAGGFAFLLGGAYSFP